MGTPRMTNAANVFAAFARPALRVPTRLAVGFGLEALEALASFTPDGGKPSLIRFPRSSAPRIRLASRHPNGGQGSVVQRAWVSSGPYI